MSWDEQENADEKRASMERELKKRRDRGEVLEPLELTAGKLKIVKTFWGRAWCHHLESYSDYESRLPRGRSYLRQGNVYNLSVEPGKIRAKVAGSMLYDVEITIKPVDAGAWEGIKEACAGKVGSLLDLLGGQLGGGVMEVICDRDGGLFPGPREIRFNCNCPDYADLCKHSGAVLYGVAVKFDVDPALFFQLRGVDPTDLLGLGASGVLAPGAEAALEGEDLSALFGIDFGDAAAVVPPLEPVPPPQVAKPLAKKKPDPKKAANGPAAAQASTKEAPRGRAKD